MGEGKTLMRWWIPLLIVLAGCAAPRSTPDAPPSAMASPLVGPQWTLVLIGTDERWQGERPAHFTLSPDGSVLRLVGSDGCNRLRGKVLLGEGRRIEVSDLATTRMACEQAQAAQVGAMLRQAYRYLIDHDRLVRRGRDRRILGGFQR